MSARFGLISTDVHFAPTPFFVLAGIDEHPRTLRISASPDTLQVLARE
jgi:hypothetical protein